MRKFESEVQNIKYKVLKEVAKHLIDGTFENKRYKIPKIISPGPKSKIRCCVYKERAIVEERIEVAVMGVKNDGRVIEVIGIACDECPAKRFTITEACRGCLAHKCIQVCPRDAIEITEGRAVIDQNKCVECGKCVTVCPFNAISDVMRPCKKACGSNAIDMDEDKRAVINRDKCTECGNCAYQCPFGAIADRSELSEIIDALKKAQKKELTVNAIVAPAIAAQFSGIKTGKVISAIKMCGFNEVYEAAKGADMVVENEALEFVDVVAGGTQKALLSSCCPAFVSHVKNNYPELVPMISTMVSPMAASGKLIKEKNPDAVNVFIGPCTAKKSEASDGKIKKDIDFVMTFEELEALIDAMEINIKDIAESEMMEASYFGRIFARSGGLTEAVKESLKEHNIYREDVKPQNLMKMRYRTEFGLENETTIDFKPVICDGIKECDKALKMLKAGRLDGNFIEGMACVGGCIGGAASISRSIKDRGEIEKHADEARFKKICDSLNAGTIDGEKLHK